MGHIVPDGYFGWVLFIPMVFFSMAKRKLREDELEYLAEHISDVESLDDPFHSSDHSSDESYLPDAESENANSEDSFVDSEDEDEDEAGCVEVAPSTSVSSDTVTAVIMAVSTVIDDTDIWSSVPGNFVPRLAIAPITQCKIDPAIKSTSSPLEIFMKLFPPSLFTFIAGCTNERLSVYNKESKKPKVPYTDPGEMMIVIGCNLVMCYNRVPKIRYYWSSKVSVRNHLISSSISRNRCMFLMSKLYFNHPTKPNNCSKIYYAEELLECFKYTFQKYRSDSSRQSIDESMVKFKGRSSLKQYLPLKPVKRGVKLWGRCDADTGYTYDTNIYCGKETETKEGTLGERVVYKLCQTIKDKNVALACDRFFSTVALFDKIQFPLVGTVVSNRKGLPATLAKTKTNLARGESLFLVNSSNTLITKWGDTKEVLLLSNCHTNAETTVKRKGKDGIRVDVACPEAIAFYNEIMGGVDLADQMSGVYEMDRKSSKWWKKVFYRLLMISIVNSWVIYNEVRRKKEPLIEFLFVLSEALIAKGRQQSKVVVRKRSIGRPTKSSKQMNNVGDHLPIEGKTRRRCTRCSRQGREKRTTTICQFCQIPLCKNCFTPYHT